MKEFYKNIVSKSYSKVNEKIGNYHPNFSKEILPSDEVARLQAVVFAPDVSGNPTSDIAYYLNCGDASFKEYMRTHLMASVQKGDVISDSADDAAKFVKPNMMSNEQFFELVDHFVHEQAKSSE